MSQNVQNIVDHGSRKDSGFLEETEKWISLTFDRRKYADLGRRLIWERKRFNRGERQVNFTDFWISGMVRNILERGSRKGSDVIQDERSEFHSLSIGGIVKNIVDAWI